MPFREIQCSSTWTLGTQPVCQAFCAGYWRRNDELEGPVLHVGETECEVYKCLLSSGTQFPVVVLGYRVIRGSDELEQCFWAPSVPGDAYILITADAQGWRGVFGPGFQLENLSEMAHLSECQREGKSGLSVLPCHSVCPSGGWEVKSLMCLMCSSFLAP